MHALPATAEREQSRAQHEAAEITRQQSASDAFLLERLAQRRLATSRRPVVLMGEVFEDGMELLVG